MAAPGNVVGLDCYAYRNTGTYGTPVWVIMGSVINVNQKCEKAAAKLNKRGSTWVRNRTTLKDLSVELTVLWDGTAADCLALSAAAVATTVIDCCFLDATSATTGASGYRAQFEVFSGSRSEPLEEGVTASYTLKPSAQGTNDPSYYTVA